MTHFRYLKIFLLFLLIFTQISSVYSINVDLIGSNEIGDTCIFNIDNEIITIKEGKTYRDGDLFIHVLTAYSFRGDSKSMCELITNFENFNARNINDNLYESINKDNEDQDEAPVDVININNEYEIGENISEDNTTEIKESNNSNEISKIERQQIKLIQKRIPFFTWLKEFFIKLWP